MIRTLGWSKAWFMSLCHCSLRHTRALWSAAPTNALISSFSSQAYVWKPCENTGPEIHCGEAKAADPYFCHRLKYNTVQRTLLDLCWQFDWEHSDSFELFYFSLNHQEHLWFEFPCLSFRLYIIWISFYHNSLLHDCQNTTWQHGNICFLFFWWKYALNLVHTSTCHMHSF